MAIKKKVKEDLRREFSFGGPLTQYLSNFRQLDADAASGLEADIVETFTTESGLRVLKMLEKSILNAVPAPGASDCALRELNAQRILVAEIRRYVAHG